MKDIIVFKKNEKKYQYILLRSFNKDEDLELWLNTTTENKNNLLIMRQYKKKQNDYRCYKCGKISSAEEIDMATKNNFGDDIESISSEDMINSDYVCPKCKEIISGYSFRKIE